MAMQWSTWAVCAAFGASLLVGSDASAAAGTQISREKSLHIPTAVLLQSAGSSSTSALVEEFLQGKGPGTEQIAKQAEKMQVGEALKRLEGKMPSEVPPEVVALVHKNNKQPFSEASLEKANNIFRSLIVKGWQELDKKIIECKEFEDRNRGTYDQVMTDLRRLGEQIADLERQRAEANENINTKEIEFMQVQFELRKQMMIYMKIRWANKQEMIIRKNDMEVMLFALRFTECPQGIPYVPPVGLLAQIKENGAAKACDCGPAFNFDDPKLQAQLQKMSPTGRESITAALSGVVGAPTLSLMQSASARTNAAPPPPPDAANRKAKVQERMSLKSLADKCPCGSSPCEVLHDKVSLLWGKFQDMVDELQAEMDQNEAKYEALRVDLTTQMEIIKVAKGRYMMMLAEVISNLNADQSEQAEKEVQRQELDAQYYKFMSACRKEIERIICDDIVAWYCIRNAVMVHSVATNKGEKMIQDCEVTYWVPSDCSVGCDDSCPTIFKPNDDPYSCGGWQTLTRRIVTNVTEESAKYGVPCPALTTTRKCNQQKCPVDCEMSMWSGWSKCTKDCEGGVRGRTRSILTKPKNGGESCNTVQEEESCNTGSCDRDCTLHSWTEWGFCTMSCKPCDPVGPQGLQERVRRVDVPTRGEGVCPKETSATRFAERECNSHCCSGTEICIAQQDLIIAIDGSGSLREFGFNVIKEFAEGLVDRYKTMYYGELAMQIGVVEFGNGEVKDGAIASAIEVVKLTNDTEAVKSKIKAMKFQGGFTNMAQALVLADKMLSSGRRKAQSAVLVITDGKPSLIFETNEQIVKMKDKSIKLFFAPVTSEAGADVQLMKHWASQPWESHLVHVPGIYALKGSSSAFEERFIATFCPQAFDPNAKLAEEKELGYFLLKTHSICGDPTIGNRLSTTLTNPGECAALVRGAKCGKAGEAEQPCEAFSYGEWFRKGYCYSEHFPIDEAKIKAWQTPMARENPDAPCDDSGGKGWVYNPFYDTYVLETISMGGV